MKQIVLLFGFCFVIATHATAKPHVWTLKSGNTVEGDFFSSGATAVVLKRDGTNLVLKISDLSSNDLTFVALKQLDLRQARLDADLKQFVAHGIPEFTSDQMLHSQEKMYGKTGWIDAEFYDLHGDPKFFATSAWASQSVIFSVKDKTGQLYSRCVVVGKSSPYFGQICQQVQRLKQGDRIRLTCTAPIPSGTLHETWLQVQKFEMIESVAEKKLRESAKQFSE